MADYRGIRPLPYPRLSADEFQALVGAIEDKRRFWLKVQGNAVNAAEMTTDAGKMNWAKTELAKLEAAWEKIKLLVIDGRL